VQVLEDSELPGYFIRAFLQVMPPELTRETAGLFVRYLAHHRQEIPTNEHGIPASSDVLDSSRVGVHLSTRWTAEGGELTELTKLVTMAVYRDGVLQANPWYTRRRGRRVPGLASAYLETFWAAGGHDLTELSRFLKSVDRENLDWLPR